MENVLEESENRWPVFVTSFWCWSRFN